jgi:hypothetical protein
MKPNETCAFGERYGHSRGNEKLKKDMKPQHPLKRGMHGVCGETGERLWEVKASIGDHCSRSQWLMEFA